MKISKVLCMGFVVACLHWTTKPACGQGVLSMRDLLPDIPEEVPGSLVPTPREAAKLATKAYMNNMGHCSDQESFDGPRLFFLGFDMEGFAKSGDRIWEVRITGATVSDNVSLRAIAWVNPETAQVLFLCSPWQHERPESSAEVENPFSE